MYLSYETLFIGFFFRLWYVRYSQVALHYGYNVHYYICSLNEIIDNDNEIIDNAIKQLSNLFERLRLGGRGCALAHVLS